MQEHEFLCRVSRIGHSHRLLGIAPELEELASKVLTVEMVAARQRQSPREKRTGAPPRQRPEEMTEPGVQKAERPVPCELLPLPTTFPENEVVESERIRGLSRAVRSRVKRRVGLASMNEIFGKKATSEAAGRPSAMQLSSLSRICDAYRVISSAECNSTAEAFKALCVKQATFKEGLVSRREDGR